jgi:hypothetical protein
MSLRFASPRTVTHRPGWRAAGRGLLAPALARAANDNGPVAESPVATRFDPLLTKALRHFAVHGLAATEAAVDAAAEARLCGDEDAKDHWLALAQMFDRRAAIAGARSAPA